jgi:phosphoribosyl-AMP cyclohydrolase
MKNKISLQDLKFNHSGLITTVIQDAVSNQILMVAWMNNTAFEKTLQSGEVHFWSRSRDELWRKGETSGNFLFVKEIFVDCDCDTILIKVTPSGPVCHTGRISCFFRNLEL